MKKLGVLAVVVLVGVLAWLASAPRKLPDGIRISAPAIGGYTPDRRVPPAAVESVVPPSVLAPTATSKAPILSRPGGTVIDSGAGPRPMIVPVAGIPRTALHDMFDEVRGNRRHEAIDILAPRGTPVIATDDGSVKKLFTSAAGGLTVYQYDPDERFCYYYAHLDRYAAGLHEGQVLRRGELVGYVGTTGNAPKDTPHLHFALIRLDADRRWWKGTYVNPYPLLR